MMSERATIFLAHSTEDLLDARTVRNGFEVLEHDVLLLKLSQRMERSFLENLLRKEIQAHDWLVVVASENSEKSDWVEFEQAYARKSNKPVFYIELEQCHHLSGPDREYCIRKQIEEISRLIRVFLSYNHQHDSEIARRIAEDLRNYGYEVWLDIENIEGGIEFATAIKAAIDQTLERGALVVLASDYGIQSNWVRSEFEYALSRGGRVIPCIVEPKPRDMPIQLQRIQWIDFTRSYQEGLNLLLRSLG